MEVFGDRKEDMIYLSPDAEEVLEEVDPSKIFIIGGIADVNIKKVSSPKSARLTALCNNSCFQELTVRKANELEIRTACLPLKRFSDSKRTVLNVNHGKQLRILIQCPFCNLSLQ